MARYDTPGVRYDSGVRYDETSSPQLGRIMNLINRSISRMGVDQVIALFTLVKANLLKPENATLFTNSAAVITAIDAAMAPLVAAHNAVLQNEIVAKSLTDVQQTALAACAPAAKAAADYGDKIANGDVAKAQLLGMPLHKATAPIQLTKPSGFSVSTSDVAGNLDWHCDTMAGVHLFEVETSPDPMTATSFALKTTSTQSKGSVGALPSGSKVWTRIRAIGGHNAPGPYSDPICRVVP
jgi:hypothetical protein